MSGIRISRRELRRPGREARVGILGIVYGICSPVHVVVDEFPALLERVWLLAAFFFVGGGVEVREDEGGGFGQFELGVGLTGREFEVVLQPGAEGVGVEGFGDVLRDIHRGGRPAMTRWFEGHQHGVETAGLEEVGVHFVEEVIGPIGSGSTYRTA